MRAIMGYLLRTIHNISKTPNSLQLLMYVFALFLSPPRVSIFSPCGSQNLFYFIVGLR